jgi:hypothetical protein
MKIARRYRRQDGTEYETEMEIDLDALSLYMAQKADRNRSRECTQVERTVSLKITFDNRSSPE